MIDLCALSSTMICSWPLQHRNHSAEAIEDFKPVLVCTGVMKRYLSLVEVEWGGKRMYWTMQVCFSPSRSADRLCIHSCGWRLEMHRQQMLNTSRACSYFHRHWQFCHHVDDTLPAGGKVEAFRQTNTAQSKTAVRNLANAIIWIDLF